MFDSHFFAAGAVWLILSFTGLHWRQLRRCAVRRSISKAVTGHLVISVI
jgi:hypothetical protein